MIHPTGRPSPPNLTSIFFTRSSLQHPTLSSTLPLFTLRYQITTAGKSNLILSCAVVQLWRYSMERLISGLCLLVRHCAVAMTPPHKEIELFQDVSKTSLTFFFFLRLTFTPSTDTTMLTFFFLMFFTLNSYCREKTGKHMLINILVWIKNTAD